jgi:hypothetical protein
MHSTYGAGRAHGGHRDLLWIAEGPIQSKILSSYRWKVTFNLFAFCKETARLLINFNEVLLKDGITRIINAPERG